MTLVRKKQETNTRNARPFKRILLMASTLRHFVNIVSSSPH
jgi:hypothetical protein